MLINLITYPLFCLRTNLVHIVTYRADAIDSFVIWRIANIGKSHLQVLAIEATCGCLVGELMPVSTHNLRMLQCRANIRSIRLATLLLVLNANQRVVEQTLIHCSKVELTNNHRLVQSLWLAIVSKGEVVHIVADSVAILRTDSNARGLDERPA